VLVGPRHPWLRVLVSAGLKLYTAAENVRASTEEVSKMSGKVAGIAAIVLSLVSGIIGILYYVNHHTRRGLVLLIGFVLLLVLGILFLVLSGRKR